MKRKLFTALLALLLVITLAACGGSVVEPTPGTWDDHVYTSDYLGFRFVLPFPWENPTELQRSIMMGLGQEVVGGELDLPDDIDLDQELELFVQNPITGANIQIRFEAHGSRRAPTGSDFQEGMTEAAAEMGAGRVTPQSGTTRIGDSDWYSVSIEMELFGQSMNQRHFFSEESGYIRMIVVTYSPGVDNLSDIMALFVGLEGPLPAVPEVGQDPALLYTWHWDANDDYTYTFNADGTGSRGFSGVQEPFEWRTADDTLVLSGALMAEVWTFTIDGDVFTIDSQQAPGMTFSYIREGAGADASAPPAAGAPAGDEHYAGLVGTWDWDESALFTYVFNADGTGTRGIPGNIESFEWRTIGDNLMIDFESWTFTIEDGVLTIDSRQIAGMTFSYIRR